MIVVKVELWSANTGQITELARAVIHNIGQNAEATKADYECYTLKGRDRATFDAKVLDDHGHARDGKVTAFPKKSSHVWNLVARALKSMNYK